MKVLREAASSKQDKARSSNAGTADPTQLRYQNSSFTSDPTVTRVPVCGNINESTTLADLNFRWIDGSSCRTHVRC